MKLPNARQIQGFDHGHRDRGDRARRNDRHQVARLLEGAPATETSKAAGADPVVAAVLGGMDPQQAIISGGGPVLADSNGVPWNGRYIVASGNLLADFYANVTAEAQGRLQTARLWNMTDHPGVKNMLKFNLARDTYRQNMWLSAIEEPQSRRTRRHHRPECVARRGIRRARGNAVAPVRRHDVRPGPAPDGVHENRFLAASTGEPAAATVLAVMSPRSVSKVLSARLEPCPARPYSAEALRRRATSPRR